MTSNINLPEIWENECICKYWINLSSKEELLSHFDWKLSRVKAKCTCRHTHRFIYFFVIVISLGMYEAPQIKTQNIFHTTIEKREREKQKFRMNLLFDCFISIHLIFIVLDSGIDGVFTSFLFYINRIESWNAHQIGWNITKYY